MSEARQWQVVADGLRMAKGIGQMSRCTCGQGPAADGPLRSAAAHCAPLPFGSGTNAALYDGQNDGV